MDFSFIEIKTILLIGHLFGIALGAGGAFLSDGMFFMAIRDRTISTMEMKYLEFASRCVFLGLIILILSGLGMFLLDAERYLDSSKFIAKIVVISIIVVNGILLHAAHLPRMRRHVDSHLPSSDEFTRGRSFLLASGAVSVISWSSAIILGAFPGLPFSTLTILGVYAGVLAFGIVVALLLRDIILPRHEPQTADDSHEEQ